VVDLAQTTAKKGRRAIHAGDKVKVEGTRNGSVLAKESKRIEVTADGGSDPDRGVRPLE
jgi:hypothetical protein